MSHKPFQISRVHLGSLGPIWALLGLLRFTETHLDMASLHGSLFYVIFCMTFMVHFFFGMTCVTFIFIIVYLFILSIILFYFILFICLLFIILSFSIIIFIYLSL